MRIRRIVYKIYEDRNIDAIIREYGISRTAKEVGMYRSNLCLYLSGKQPIPEKFYRRIKSKLLESK